MAKDVFGVPVQWLMFIVAGVCGGLVGAIVGWVIGGALAIVLAIAGLPIYIALVFMVLGWVAGSYVAWRVYERLR